MLAIGALVYAIPKFVPHTPLEGVPDLKLEDGPELAKEAANTVFDTVKATAPDLLNEDGRAQLEKKALAI